jgi:hypothetical protein
MCDKPLVGEQILCDYKGGKDSMKAVIFPDNL